MHLLKKSVWLFAALLIAISAWSQQTFTNPLLPSGADPFSFYKDGYYYYTHTTGRNVTIWKTKNLSDLKTAERKVIYSPPDSGSYSRDIWAPEIHFIDGKWYAYFAADDGHNKNHRMYVVENASADPLQGEWTLKGKVADAADKWAIDGHVFIYRKQLYMLWSGWQGDTNGQQDIFIAKMKNPWTISGGRARLSSPTFAWETIGDLNDANNPRHVNVNEGPQSLMNGNKLFIVYSASGCWTDQYTLGILSFEGGNNLLDSSKWKKHPQPLFKQTPENGVYAPGHNSFFKSPDGKEDWILYHANSHPGEGCGRFRSPRAQKFSWNKDGLPYFGEPVKENMQLEAPSNSKK
jgi:GH43 family beta-xylosidase